MESFSVSTLKNILIDSVKRHAASVHFSVGNFPVVKIDGEMFFLDNEKIVDDAFLRGLVGFILTDEQNKVLQVKKEIILAYQFDPNLRFKVTVFYQKGFLAATLRYIPAKLSSLESLGLSRIVERLSKIDKGLVLISGPFGSGRSTTIAGIIEEINKTQKRYIITIEDPIEYIFSNQKSVIEQREVGKDTKSFFDALNYFQEEDADVLFLEEIKEAQIIPLVLEIAGGSALVLTAVSAGSVSQTLFNILANFQSPDQERIRNLLATAVKAVVCQKLIAKNGGGLVPIYEILFNNEAVKSTILSGDFGRLDDIIQTSRSEGMMSFDQSLVEMVKTGKISDLEAVHYASDRRKISDLLK